MVCRSLRFRITGLSNFPTNHGHRKTQETPEQRAIRYAQYQWGWFGYAYNLPSIRGPSSRRSLSFKQCETPNCLMKKRDVLDRDHDAAKPEGATVAQFTGQGRRVFGMGNRFNNIEDLLNRPHEARRTFRELRATKFEPISIKVLADEYRNSACRRKEGVAHPDQYH